MLSETHLTSLSRNSSPCSRKMQVTGKNKSIWKTRNFKLMYSNRPRNVILSYVILKQGNARQCTVRTIAHADTTLCSSRLSDTRRSESLNHECPHHKCSQVPNPNQHTGPYLDFKQSHTHTTYYQLLRTVKKKFFWKGKAIF